MRKKDLKKIVKTTADYSLFIQRSLLIMSVLFFLVEHILKKNLFICFALLMLGSLMYAFSTFCLSEYYRAKKQFNIMAAAVAFCVCGMVNGMVISLPVLPFSFKLLFNIFVDFFIMLFAYWYVHPDEEKRYDDKTKMEKILKKDIYSEDSEFEEGDTFLGYNYETGKPNIIPYKDRFLHFLVLGVTGCGKTSQSLIPMVEKDMDYENLGIVCLDPKGDFAETVYALAVAKGRGDKAIYFNPTLADCPKFNPMIGDIDSVSECLVTTFKKLENEPQTFFANMNEMLLRRCIKITKWLYGDDACLNDINLLMNNANNEGKKMLSELNDMFASGKLTDMIMYNEFVEINSWFTEDYYSVFKKDFNTTKTYEQCAGVRNQVSKLLANSLVKKILCPTNEKTGQRIYKDEMLPSDYINFDEVLRDGWVLAMSSAQGELRELGTFIGYFLILSFESAVFRRPGDENTRGGVIFYVDEFQKYANDGYSDLLTQGRSYRVSSVLATQTRAGIAANSTGSEGKTLIETVSSNCRNKIVYPDCSREDAEYYSKEFGEVLKKKQRVSHSQSKSVLSKISPANQNENISTEEKYEARFTPTDIKFRPFGEAVCLTVKNNSVQDPQVVKLKFINKKIYDQCNTFIKNRIRPRQVNYIDSEYLPEENSKPTSLNSMGNYQVDNQMGNDSGLYSDEFENLEDIVQKR